MGTAGKVSKYSNLFTSYFIHYPHYLKIKRLLDRKVFETKEQVEQYQYLQMKKIVTHAFHHVPYYRKLFSDIGFKPGDFRSLDDLLKIPLLTKEIIKENREELKAENIPEKHFKVVQTGGTTGMPAEFFLDKRYSSLTEMVFLRHMWKKLGYRQRDRCIVLREDEVAGIQEGERYWNRNLLTNWLIMSAFHLNEDTFPLFYDQIQSFKPKFILAFPSNAYLLARFIRERSLPSFPSVKGIICSSENLFDWQREYIGDVLNAPIFSFYGHSEKCILASECSDLSGYEFYPQYGYVELVNERGTGCTEENERGEIVATGFHNYVSPLIRYKTGDMATFTNEGGSDHPGWYKIRNLEGRVQDYLVDHDNVPKTYLHIDRPFWNIREKVYAYQYVQDEPGKVLLNIHPKEELAEAELAEIKNVFHNTYFKFDLDIRQVAHIPRTSSGKFRYLVQNMKLK